MPEIETTNEWAKGLQGLNLFHFAVSNCSQRVRVALEEKGLAWHDQHLDLMNNAHATDHYKSINPKGVVPTLVHDGRTIIESIDIISYLDSLGNGPKLMPEEDALAAEMHHLLNMADGIQGAVKVLSHEFLFKPMRKKSPKQIAEMRQTPLNPALIDFLEEFSKGFSKEFLTENVGQFETAFNALDASLAKHGGPWLAGQQFTLADVAWIVNVHRVALMRWDFSRTPHLQKWITAMQARPAYQKALAAYEPKGVLFFFGAYSRLRGLLGGGVNAFRA